MKILILTASIGGGHNSAANSLKIEIEKQGHISYIHDIFRRKEDKNYKDILEKSYNTIISKAPDLYREIYKISNHRFTNKFLKHIFFINALKIKKIIEENDIDCIISTIPLGVSIVSLLKKFYFKDMYFMQIITDFKAHKAYVDKRVNSYIVGSEWTKETLIKNNISQDRIYVLGIPASEEFRIKKEENNDDYDDEFKILIMGGSMGFTGISDTIDSLLESNIKFSATVVCAKNIELKQTLDKKFGNIDNLNILGYCDNISELMKNSNLLISKPGGLTTTEAIYSNLPMIIPFAIPGQEEENTEFLVKSGMAYYVENIKDLPNVIKDLIKNKIKYNDMIEKMKELSEEYNISEIIKILEKNINKDK